jgi:hypothetical protein
MEKIEDKGIFAKVYKWFKNLTVKGLLGAILVAFIIMIILTSISYLPKITNSLYSSLSGAIYSVFIPADKATMSADKVIINSGEDFTINFKKGDDTGVTGLFTVSYTCSSNANLMSVETDGLKNIGCDKPYYLLGNEAAIKIRPITKDSVVRLVVTGSFENSDTQKTDTVGVVRVTIKNSAVGTIVNPPNTTKPSVANPNTVVGQTPTYYGKPDLAIRMLQVGLLNTSTNLITTQNQFLSTNMVGIKFEVRNDGDANTGAWSFAASLPSVSTPVYNSNTQISLRPGESIIFTLGFTNLTNTGLLTISVDPQKIVTESNKNNNVITSTITSYGYNNNNNYNNLNYNNGYYDSYGNFISYNTNYNYNNSYNTLGVTCYGNPSSLDTGERVRWYANAFGGNGDYNYTWTGSNGLDSTSQNPSKTYSSTGQKQAVVTVESNGLYATQTCSVNVY